MNQYTNSWVSMSLILAIVIVAMLHGTSVGHTNTTQPASDMQDAAWNYNQGIQAIEKQNYIDSIQYFKRSLEQNPYYKQSFKGLGEAYYLLKNFDESLLYFKKAYDLQKDDINSLQWLAKVKIAMNQIPQAEMYIREAILLDNRNPLSYEIYGDCFMAQRKHPEAIVQYSESFYIDPQTVVPLLHIANCHIEAGQYDFANKYLHLARNNDPQNYLVNYELGRYHFLTKDYDNTDRHLGLCLQFFPTFEPALSLRATLYFEQKKWKEAAEVLQFSSTLNKYNPMLFYRWGVALEKMAITQEDYEHALQIYIRGINLDKGNEIIRWRCEDASVKPKVLKPDHYIRKRLAEMNDEMGNFNFEDNHFEKALLYYKRSIRLNPIDPKVRLKVARIYKMQGFIERYLNELKVIHELDPRVDQIGEDIEYYQRVTSRMLSREHQIFQHEIPKELPLIVITTLQPNVEKPLDKDPIEVEKAQTIKDMLYSVLLLKSNLNVKMIEDESIPDEIRQARSMGGKFILQGSFKEQADRFDFTIRLINIDNGIQFDEFTVSQTGNNKMILGCMELADKVALSMPMVGKIIEKWGNQIIVNLGRMQNVKVGDRFYVFPDQQTVDILLQQKAHLTQTSALEHSLGEIEITKIDEQICEGSLLQKGVVDRINEHQYIIPRNSVSS